MKRWWPRILSALLVAAAGAVQAEELLMLRSPEPFAETMLALQGAIGAAGYKVSRVQRVDIGLTTFGYQTEKYRVVFFGDPQEVRTLSRTHPELIPYLPLKIAIFAEGGETLLVAANPERFEAFYPDPALEPVFERWAQRIHQIYAAVRAAE